MAVVMSAGFIAFATQCGALDTTECGSGRCGNDLHATLGRYAYYAATGRDVYWLSRGFSIESISGEAVAPGSLKLHTVSVFQTSATARMAVVTYVDPPRPSVRYRFRDASLFTRHITVRTRTGQIVQIYGEAIPPVGSRTIRPGQLAEAFVAARQVLAAYPRQRPQRP